jgi:hypothetical protein
MTIITAIRRRTPLPQLAVGQEVAEIFYREIRMDSGMSNQLCEVPELIAYLECFNGSNKDSL